MLVKKIKYTDFNGQEREEDFYFNLTQSEITKMELSTAGGLANKITRVAQTQDGAEILKIMEDFIDMSYGVKSDDGRRFVKSPEISKAFRETPAYDQLFLSIATDPKAAADFINGVVPQVPETK